MKRFVVKLKKFGYWNISFKLLASTAMFILASVFLVSFLSYNQYTKDFREQSASRVQQIIEQVSLNIDTYLDDVFRLSLSPYYNRLVMEALEEKAGSTDMTRLEKTRLIEDFLDQMMIIPRKDILRVFILADDIYTSERMRSSIDDTTDFRSLDWYKKALATQNTIFVPAHMEQIVKNPKHKVFSVVKQIRSTRDTSKLLGVIKVDANYSGIESICNKVNMGKEGGLFIIDGNKNIIFSNIADIPYQTFYEKAKSSKTPFVTVSANSKAFLLNSASIPRSNWTIIAVTSLSEINQKARQTRNTAFLLAFICSAFAILVLAIFIKWFLKPLLHIIRLIREIQTGNLSVKFPQNRHDEIGYLGTAFNEMVTKIRSMLEQNTRLIKEVYEAKFLQKEAQMNTLFNQIRPHFIYNTLNMISLSIQCGKTEKAVDTVNKLSSILRSIANWDKDVTVQCETDLLNAYLSIQNNRYGGRLEYGIDIDEALYPCIIPALILQPIVENAVIHGCEAKRDKTVIRVTGREEGNDLIFTVEDTGIGMDTGTLERLREKIRTGEYDGNQPAGSKEKDAGIGLVNVNRRIKLRYGRDYGLEIDSLPGEGTCVRIILPKHPSNREGNAHV